MLLAVDVGNTQTVLGLYKTNELLFKARIATTSSDTADELLIKLQGLFMLHEFSCGEVSNVAIASVVPSLTEHWRKAALSLTTVEPLILTNATDTGLTISFKNPSEIGADRLAVAVAGIHFYGTPVVIVDFGTATNIEVIDTNGAFIGGIIAPGLLTSAEALFSAAARLSKIDIEIPETVIGVTTKGAVQSGLTYGEIDRIDGLILRIFDELGYQTPVVATGGLSQRVVRLSKTITHINDDLTLEGLRLIFQRQFFD